MEMDYLIMQDKIEALRKQNALKVQNKYQTCHSQACSNF